MFDPNNTFKPPVMDEKWSGYIQMIAPPKHSTWQAHLLGKKGRMIFRPFEGCEPNWFHRNMQRLCFGIIWENTMSKENGLKFRLPWRKPSSPNGEKWKYVIIPRHTSKGWKAFCWLPKKKSPYWY